MTRAVTIIALTCFLVVGAAATSILGRDSVPAARSVMVAPEPADPVSNKLAKKDKLAVATLALASLEPPQTADLGEPSHYFCVSCSLLFVIIAQLFCSK